MFMHSAASGNIVKKIFVCTNSRPFSGQPSCAYRGSESLIDFLKEQISNRALDIIVEASVCMGHCPLGPNIKPEGSEYIHEADQSKLFAWLDEQMVK
ncbi:MAG: NADH:ubiquinone oxidoreductase subunit E [Flavobacterium sp.]|jgi:NADH:ubiquinone oxidoreductase subunit E